MQSTPSRINVAGLRRFASPGPPDVPLGSFPEPTASSSARSSRAPSDAVDTDPETASDVTPVSASEKAFVPTSKTRSIRQP